MKAFENWKKRRKLSLLLIFKGEVHSEQVHSEQGEAKMNKFTVAEQGMS